MGTKHSKTSSATPAQQKREREDAEHKEYVKKVLGRNDASQELKAALIECAETKKSLRESQSSNDFLKSELALARVATDKVNTKHQDAMDLNRTVIVSSALIICSAFFLLFGVFVSMQYGHTDGLQQRSGTAGSLPGKTVMDMSGRTEVLVIAKQRFINSLGDSIADASGLWEQLSHSKDKITYFQLLAIVQNDLLPKLTLSLIAACMAVTLIVIAAIGYVAPRWPTMTARGKFECSVASMVMFLVTGLYLSSVDDSIDIPAGVLLATGVLLSPLVVTTGFQLVYAYTPVQQEVAFVKNWQTMVSSFGVMALSLVLLHTVSFAPLVVVFVTAFTAMVITTLLVALDVRAATSINGRTLLVIQATMCVLSWVAWSCSDGIADFIQPSRYNALYPLVTDVASWLDWSLMLSTFAWCAGLHQHVAYGVHLPEAMYISVVENAAVRFMVLQVGPTLSFLHLLLYLNSGADVTSARYATVAMFAHILWGTYFAAESMFLTVASYRSDGFGLSEQVVLLNSVLLWLAFTRSYSVLMVYSVVNIAAYVLLKFGVMASAVLAVLVIMVGVQYR